MRPLRLFVVLALAAAVAAGCAATRQARSVNESGFLGDYSRLEKCGGRRAKLCYNNPNAQWRSYDKILLDPVTIWTGKDSELAGMPADQRQKLANYFYKVLDENLGKDYKIVSDPGPGTIRLQVAITDAEGSTPVLNTVSAIVPQLRTITTLQGYITGKPLFTGEVETEFKATDSLTGELLAEGIDKRVGNKQLMSSVGWSAVEDAMKFWATLARYRLCELRGQQPDTCPKLDESYGI
jgi:hypothetical protein